MALIAKAEWKEGMRVVDEQGRSFMFDCGWGVDQPVAYVPAVERWTSSVPTWLHDRREDVIEAMKAASHRVVDGPYPELHDRDWTQPIAELDHARTYFCAMGCSHFQMLREHPERYAEYRAFQIARETEIAWARDAFFSELRAFEDVVAAAPEAWGRYRDLAELTRIVGALDVTRELCAVTERLVPLAVGRSRILAAETLAGHETGVDPDGPIALASRLGDPELARRFVKAALALCSPSSATFDEFAIEERRSSAVARIQSLRERLDL